MQRSLLLGILVLAQFATPAGADDARPKLEPGTSFTIVFPELPPTLYAMTTKEKVKPSMTVALPKNYDPHRKHPLLVFLSGGNGGGARQANVARALSEDQEFVCVALPLFRAKLDPPPEIGLRPDDFPFMWTQFKTMLARLDQLVPNIDAAHRIIGGFSNGGHTTAGLIDMVGDEFTSYFSAYYFVEGGGRFQHFERIKNRPLLVLYGGARGRDWDALLGKPAAEAGVKVTMHKMESIGHDFPAAQYPVVRKWLRGIMDSAAHN